MVQISYVNKPVGAEETFWFYGQDFNSASTEIFYKSSFTNEYVNTTSSIENEARRRSIVSDYIDNGYNISSFGSSTGKTSVSRWSLHSNELISFRSINARTATQPEYYTPYWVTTDGRTQSSSGYLINKPEIWGVEASNLPSNMAWFPGQEFLIYGSCLTDNRTKFPSIWLLPSGQSSSSIFEIENVDYSFINSDSIESSQFVAMARLRKTYTPATLNTTSSSNEARFSVVSCVNNSSGNNLRLGISYGGSFGVSIGGNDILVTAVSGVTAASSVISALNADVSISAQIRAFNYYRSSGTGFVTPIAYTNLSGGTDQSDVPSGIYYVYTSNDSTVYGVTGYSRPFRVDNQPEQFHYVYGSGFTYWNIGVPSGFYVSDLFNVNDQTKALQTLMMRAQQVQQTGVPRRRVKIVIPEGEYVVNRPITPPPSSVIDPGIACLVSIKADCTQDFSTDNMGSDFPPAPSGFAITFTNYERPLINLKGYSELANLKLVGAVDQIPQYRPPSALIQLYLEGHNYIHDLDLEHNAIDEEKWNYTPCGMMITTGASYNKIKNIKSQTLTFCEFVSGTAKYNVFDTIAVNSPNRSAYYGSVGRLGTGECIMKNVQWENLFRGITDTGRNSMQRYRNLYFQCAARHGAYNVGGAEQLLWESAGYYLENPSQSGLYLIGRTQNNNDTIYPDAYFAIINSGIGVGQYRRIIAVSGSYNISDSSKKYYLTLDQPWLVNPNASSVVLIGQFPTENVVTRFKTDHCARGIIVYGGCVATNIVESEFNTVEQAVWMHGRRTNNTDKSQIRVDSNLHTYIGYNKFINCEAALSYTSVDYGTGGHLSGTFLNDPLCVGLYFVYNSVDAGIQFASSAVVTEPDFTCMSFNFNTFDQGFFNTERSYGFIGQSEYMYGAPRILSNVPIGIGGINKAWPVREHGNMIYTQQITTTNITSGFDGELARVQGGSSNLWGPEYAVADLRGANKSLLMRPSGYPYYNGTDGNVYLGGVMRTVQSPTGIITIPNICNAVTVITSSGVGIDWTSVIAQIQTDLQALQTISSGLIDYEVNITPGGSKYRLTYQTPIGPISPRTL